MTYSVQGKHYILNKGNFIIIPPKFMHQLIERSKTTVSYHLTFNLLDNLKDKNVYFEESNSFILNLFKITGDRILDNDFNEIAVSSLVFSVISSLKPFKGKYNLDLLSHENPSGDVRLECAKEFIKDNIKGNPSANDVSRYCYLSQKQLSRIFLKYEGVTLSKYILNERLKLIEKLITENKTMQQISVELNFNNECYFNTFFKKRMGITTAKYRKEN